MSGKEFIGETVTDYSSKFKLHKKWNYINELQSEDFTVTNLSNDNMGDYTSAGAELTYYFGSVNLVRDMRKAFFRVRWGYAKADGTSLIAGDIAARSNTVVENNWFYKMFKTITLFVNGSPVETVNNPGEIDTLIKHINGNYLGKQNMNISGWIPDKGNGSTLANIPTYIPPVADADIDAPAEVRTHLTNIGAIINEISKRNNNLRDINTGFIERKKRFPVAVTTFTTSYETDFPIYPLFAFFYENRIWTGVNFMINLVIKGDNQKLLLFGTDYDLSIKIYNIKIIAPTYQPTYFIKDDIYKELKQEIQVKYLKRTLFTRPIIPTENEITWEITNKSERSRYLFVWFKPSGREDQRVNDDLYYLNSVDVPAVAVNGAIPAINGITAFNLQSIRLEIDDMKYPFKDILNIDVSTNDVNDLIDYYHRSATKPYQYTPEEFLNIRGIICFDVTAQIENRTVETLKYVIKLTKTGAQALNMYVLILSEHSEIVKPKSKEVILDVPV